MIETLLTLLTLVLAVILAGIAFLAYKKSHLRPALYLLIAFLLLAVKKTIEAAHTAAWIQKDVGTAVEVLEVLVMLLFILALWRR